MEEDLRLKKRNYARDADKTLEVLFEISEAVTTTRNLHELYSAIHRSLGRILNVDNFYIALHHPEKDSITFPYHVDEKDDHPEEIFNFSETASLTGRVIKARQPLIFFEQDIIDFAKEKNKKIIGTVSKVWAGAPLIIKDSVIGAIAMQSFNSPDDYRGEDLDILNTISQHIALAIERKESDEKLTEQQKILEKILESSPMGICLVENQVFKWVNNEMLKIFGYEKKEDLKNAGVRKIYNSEADYKAAGKIILHDLREKGRSDFDFYLKKNDGGTFKAHIILTGSQKGNPLESMIGTFSDMSQHELAQKEKLEREKLQGVLEMARAVCHEFNQPLEALVEHSGLFQSDKAIPSRELNLMKSQAMQLGEITKRLSNITRYKTISHSGDTKIVDIWGSSNDDPLV